MDGLALMYQDLQHVAGPLILGGRSLTYIVTRFNMFCEMTLIAPGLGEGGFGSRRDD